MDAKEKLEKIFYENFISSDGEKFVVEDNQEFEVRIKIQKDVSRCRIKSAEISAGNQILTIDGSEKFLNNIFVAMLHGKATDSIAIMAGKKLVKNTFENSGQISNNDLKLIINGLSELCGTLGVSTHKLLSVAIAKFTELNHTGEKKRDLRNLNILIPLKEYALKCGYDTVEHPKMSKKESEIEKKRAENALRNARKKINKDLAVLYSSSLSWHEKIRGRQADYVDIRLIEAKGIRNGFINIKFTQTFGEYLVKLPITQYPTALLKLDERNNNAYVMGLKMSEHFNIKNNINSKNFNLLRVKSLLKFTSLPKISDNSVKKAGWENRIKEPFENSLDALTKCGVLETWEYRCRKGKSDYREAPEFKNFEDWSNSILYFNLKDTSKFDLGISYNPKLKNHEV